MMAFIDFSRWLGAPVLASEHGQVVDRFINYVHWLMAVLFVGWLAYFIYVLIRFRRKRNPKAEYTGLKGHISSYIEGAVVVAETLLLVGFAIPLWATVVTDFPEPAEANEVRVIGQQFAWNFLYPGPDGIFGRRDADFVTSDNRFGLDPNDPNGKDDFEVPGEMVVPVGEPVVAHVSSLDVVHSFAVVPMRVTQDAIPGISVPTHFVPTKVGRYQITCAQLCGNSHYAMRGFLTVKTREEYDQWLAEKNAASATSGGTTTSYE